MECACNIWPPWVASNIGERITRAIARRGHKTGGKCILRVSCTVLCFVFHLTFSSSSDWKKDWEPMYCVGEIIPFIILQAPRAGSMRRILCSDWLPERARWSDTARPGLPVFVPANKLSPKFKRVHESFLSLKLLSAKVKRFFVISLSLWNQKKRQREWKQRKQKCW